MIERKSFIRGAIAGLTALVAIPKPVEPEVWADWRVKKASKPEVCWCGVTMVNGRCPDAVYTRFSITHKGDNHELWPNDKLYPCHHVEVVGHLSRPIGSTKHWAAQLDGGDCDACRAHYNHFVVASDPDWYEHIHVVDLTGHWWSLS